jgi:hypothetical protein
MQRNHELPTLMLLFVAVHAIACHRHNTSLRRNDALTILDLASIAMPTCHRDDHFSSRNDFHPSHPPSQHPPPIASSSSLPSPSHLPPPSHHHRIRLPCNLRHGIPNLQCYHAIPDSLLPTTSAVPLHPHPLPRHDPPSVCIHRIISTSTSPLPTSNLPPS